MSRSLLLPGDRRCVGIGALVAAKGLDLSTTLYGLRHAGAVELNPVATTAMARLGTLPGLLCLGLLAVLIVVGITETAVRQYEGTFLTAGYVRSLGYLPHVTLWMLATLNNVVVLSVGWT
jgi:hypothetical protein